MLQRVNVTLSLSPSEAKQVLSLVETFSGQASESESQPANQTSSANKPAETKPEKQKADKLTATGLKPLVVEAAAKNRPAVSKMLADRGLAKLSDATQAQLVECKKCLEDILAAPAPASDDDLV